MVEFPFPNMAASPPFKKTAPESPYSTTDFKLPVVAWKRKPRGEGWEWSVISWRNPRNLEILSHVQYLLGMLRMGRLNVYLSFTINLRPFMDRKIFNCPHAGFQPREVTGSKNPNMNCGDFQLISLLVGITLPKESRENTFTWHFAWAHVRILKIPDTSYHWSVINQPRGELLKDQHPPWCWPAGKLNIPMMPSPKLTWQRLKIATFNGEYMF